MMFLTFYFFFVSRAVPAAAATVVDAVIQGVGGNEAIFAHIDDFFLNCLRNRSSTLLLRRPPRSTRSSSPRPQGRSASSTASDTWYNHNIALLNNLFSLKTNVFLYGRTPPTCPACLTTSGARPIPRPSAGGASSSSSRGSSAT